MQYYDIFRSWFRHAHCITRENNIVMQELQSRPFTEGCTERSNHRPPRTSKAVLTAITEKHVGITILPSCSRLITYICIIMSKTNILKRLYGKKFLAVFLDGFYTHSIINAYSLDLDGNVLTHVLHDSWLLFLPFWISTVLRIQQLFKHINLPARDTFVDCLRGVSFWDLSKFKLTQ